LPILRSSRAALAALCLLPLATVLTAAATAVAQQKREAPPRVGEALIGSRWQAVTLSGAPVADPSRATLDFLPGDHVRGQVACNRFVAPFASRADRITIGPIRVSRLRCPDAALQQTVVDTLHEAERAVLAKEPRALELFGPSGAVSRFVPRPVGEP
jgi:heat shock protein HslJ